MNVIMKECATVKKGPLLLIIRVLTTYMYRQHTCIDKNIRNYYNVSY